MMAGQAIVDGYLLCRVSAGQFYLVPRLRFRRRRSGLLAARADTGPRRPTLAAFRDAGGVII